MMATLPVYRKRKVYAYALIDDSDEQDLSQFRWHCSQDKTVFRFVNRPCESIVKEYLHRRIVSPAQGLSVDHIDGDRFNNRRSNLRACLIHHNNWNKGKSPRNTSGYKGVYWSRGLWQAEIRANGRKYYLGRYSTPETAHKAYRDACLRLHGEYANVG